MKEDQVILVSEEDVPVGAMGKAEVHQKGLLHRAFSIFIFDAEGRMLLQQRAAGKYHGGLLWTNACCSHPFPGEEVDAAAERRLKEELGFTTPLQKVFSFTYRAEVENNLIEHEYDHVYTGKYGGNLYPDPREVAQVSYQSMHELRMAIEKQPSKFTSWFKIAFPKIESWWKIEYELKSGKGAKNI